LNANGGNSPGLNPCVDLDGQSNWPLLVTTSWSLRPDANRTNLEGNDVELAEISWHCMHRFSFTIGARAGNGQSRPGQRFAQTAVKMIH
jgi:hypothetical protein